MPLPFERRWGSDKRKKDEDKKDKRDKKKYKTKAEEQMDRQIEELSRQLTEEKHNSRRERLNVTRLQRELTQAKKDNSAKDSLMRDLSKERQSRLEAEHRLKDALLESETCKTRLENLQDEFSKMQATMNAVMEYQNNVEQLKLEKNCLVHKYENDLEKCHTRISNLERENSSLTNEIRNLEAKVTHDESIRERALLVERLKHLEAENSALVLENENQREQYEHCLDEVANQVVQALLMQKDLREECLKLHNRVQELEQQNRNMKCVFDSRGVTSYQPNSIPQPSFPHTYGNPSNPLHAGSILPSTQPCTVSSPGHNKPVSSRGTDHHSDSIYNSGVESFPVVADKMRQQQSAPSSDNVVFSSKYTTQYQAPPLLQSRYRPAVLQGNSQMQLSSHEAFVSQTCSMDRYRFHIAPDVGKPPGYGYHNGDAHGRPGDRSPQRYQERAGTFQPSVQTSSYRFTLASVRTNEGAKSPQEKNDWNLVNKSPSQRFSPDDSGGNHRMGLVNGQQESMQIRSIAPVQNGHALSPGEPKLNGHQQNGEHRNGYVLSDKYSKPYVHAPFHYAQSLLQELRDISSSVKSFESLTLDPKPGTQQKRKAEANNGSNSRQKLVKGQITLPLERDDSLESELGEGYATMADLLDTSTSSLSSASIETALERVVSLSPTPLSPSWSDEGDTLEISLDDQILDSSLEKDSRSDTEEIDEPQEVDGERSSSKEPECEDLIYAKCDNATEKLSPKNETNLLNSSSPNSPKEEAMVSSEGQRSDKAPVLLSPRQQGKLCRCSAVNGNWPHKEQYNCKVNDLQGHQHICKDDHTLCNKTKTPSPSSDSSKQDFPDGKNVKAAELTKGAEINSNCLSVSNKMQNVHSSKGCSHHHVVPFSEKTSSCQGQVHKTGGPNLYPVSPCEDACCPSPLICSGPLCTAQKKQMQQDIEMNKDDCTDGTETSGDVQMDTSSKTSPNRTKSAKEIAEKIAMTQVNYVTKAEVNLGNRSRSKTESSVNVSPWVKADQQLDSSKVITSLDVMPTPCLVLRSPVKSNKVLLLQDLTNTSDKQSPCNESVEETNNTDDKDDESTSEHIDTKLPSNISASSEDQTSSASLQKLEYQKTPYDHKIGSFITPSQEDIPPMTVQDSPKKSSCVQNLDDRPVIGVNAAAVESSSEWKITTESLPNGRVTMSVQPQRTKPVEKDDTCGAETEKTARSRSLGRNENFPISGFIKDDNVKLKKTRSLDRDSGRTPPPRQRDLDEMELIPQLDGSPRMPGRNKMTLTDSSELDSDIKPSTSQKPTSLDIFVKTKKDALDPEKKFESEVKRDQTAADRTSEESGRSSMSSHEDSSPTMQDSRGITEELIQFRSNSLGENPFLNSVSMESLQSDNSDDWGSPCKSNDGEKKAATPLSEFLSSDSDSEEENINFVEMWKARETQSPMKLPEWNPQKSVEEHRKKMRESLSDSTNRSSNLEKSSSLSSSTSSEQWLLNYPFTIDTPRSPGSSKPSSPSKQPRFSFDKCLSKHSTPTVTNGDDDVFIMENGITCPETLKKFNSLDSRKSTTSSRSSLGENSVMYDFVSSILDELDKDGVVKVQPGSPIKQNGKKNDVDKLKKNKSIVNDGHCILEMESEDKCNSENVCNQINESLQEEQCNRDVELRPVRSFSLDSSDVIESSSVDQSRTVVERTDSDSSNKRTNSPSRIPKATKRGTSNRFGQSLKKITHPKDSGEKDKKKESKIKSKIPQRIRDSFRSAISQSGHLKKRDRFPKVDIIRTAKSLPASPLLSRSPKLSPSPKLNGRRPRHSTSSSEEQKQNGSPSPILSSSPKSIHSPFSKSPRLCASPRMAGGSPILSSNGFSDSTDSIGGSSWTGRHSRKSSEASSSSFVVDNVPYIDDSSSSPEADYTKQNDKSEIQISSPMTTAYHGLEDLRRDFLSYGGTGSRTNGGLDDQISPEMIEDIKQGRLASNWDSLSLGNQSKTSHYNLKNAYSWSENLSKAHSSPEHSLDVTEDKKMPVSAGVSADEVNAEVTVGVSDGVSIDEVSEGCTSPEYKEDSEAEPCKVNVPLVDGDMMEDFEVEDDIHSDADTASIRENAAQLTEKERANLLDSLFESDDDDSDLDSISHSGSMSSADSHPGEKEFMRMIGGDKNKAVLKHHVIRHHSAIYCRVSIMQVDMSHLYTRFGEKEKEALASFDFLRGLDEEKKRTTYSDHPMTDHPHSYHQGIRIQELDSSDDDHLTFEPMMQDDTSLTGSSDQEPGLAAESMILSDIMGDSFSSSNRHSFSSSGSNSMSSQN